MKRRDLLRLICATPAAWCVSKLGLEHVEGVKEYHSLAELEADGFRTSDTIVWLQDEIWRLWEEGIRRGHVPPDAARLMLSGEIHTTTVKVEIKI